MPPRLLIGGGLALIAVGLALMTVISATSGWTVLLAGMVVSGLGSGVINPALASAAVGTVSREKAGVGSGINNTFRQVGIAVGIAGLGAIFASTVRSSFVGDLAARSPRLARHAGQLAGSVTSGGGLGAVHPSGPGAQVITAAVRYSFVTGLDRILWVAAIIAAVGAVVSATLLRAGGISSAPEASAEHEEIMRRAA